MPKIKTYLHYNALRVVDYRGIEGQRNTSP